MNRLVHYHSPYRIGYFSYLPNLRTTLKGVDDHIKTAQRVEKFLTRFVNPEEIREVFTIIDKLFSVLIGNNIRLNPHIKMKASAVIEMDSKFDFEKVKKNLDGQADRKIKVEDEYGDYETILTHIYYKEVLISKFFETFMVKMNNMSVCDLSLYDLYTSDSHDYSTFNAWIWGLFVHSLIIEEGKPNPSLIKLEQFVDDLTHLSYQLFVLKESLVQKINPYNTVPTVNFLSDFFRFTKLFRVLLEEFKDFDLTSLNSELSFGSEEDLNQLDIRKEIMSLNIDLTAISFVKNKFRLYETKNSHNGEQTRWKRI